MMKALKSGRKKYKVHWVGYPSDQDKWVREDDMTNELVEEFKNRQSSRRKKASVAAICSKEMITTLAVMTSTITRLQEDTPFKYEIKIP